jgi:hypothetical protein
LSRLALTVLLEQGLTVLLEVILVGLDEAIEPGEQLLGAMVSVEDDGHLVELFRTQHIEDAKSVSSKHSNAPTRTSIHSPTRTHAYQHTPSVTKVAHTYTECYTGTYTYQIAHTHTHTAVRTVGRYDAHWSRYVSKVYDVTVQAFERKHWCGSIGDHVGNQPVQVGVGVIPGLVTHESLHSVRSIKVG